MPPNTNERRGGGMRSAPGPGRGRSIPHFFALRTGSTPEPARPGMRSFFDLNPIVFRRSPMRNPIKGLALAAIVAALAMPVVSLPDARADGVAVKKVKKVRHVHRRARIVADYDGTPVRVYRARPNSGGRPRWRTRPRARLSSCRGARRHADPLFQRRAGPVVRPVARLARDRRARRSRPALQLARHDAAQHRDSRTRCR